MCFTATASFSAGTVLVGLGILTLKAARFKSELPFAAIPLLFAIQQFSEGLLWLTFLHSAPLLNVVMTYVYSFFSHVLWPIFLPLSVLLIEPPGRRHLVLTVFLAIGTFGTYSISTSFVNAKAKRRHYKRTASEADKVHG